MYVHVAILVSTVCVIAHVTQSASLVRSKLNENAVSEEQRESFHTLGFLEHYGYLSLPRSRDNDHYQLSETSVIQAVKDFQRFTGLKVTGHIDEHTLTKMRQPRCGFPDILGTTQASGSGSSSPQNFQTFNRRWRNKTVTWNLVQMSEKLPENQQWSALERALRHWSDVTPLQFQRTDGHADMEVMFAKGDHGDGSHNRFNGPGGILAHAFQPGEGIGGDTHLDEDEDWTLGTGQGPDVEIVAAHEFGHALGLAHSSVAGALMAPYYGYTPSLRLHTDDIQGIQSLYGHRRRTIRSSTTTTTTPTTPTATSTSTTTTSTITTTTKTATTPTTTLPTKPRYCGEHFRVDAVVDVGEPGGIRYLFIHDKVYRVGSEGLQAQHPLYISQLFPGGPRRHIDAAVYLPESRTHLLFKGHKVWRFKDFRLQENYPKIWLAFPQYLRLQKHGDLNLQPLYSDYLKLRPSAALSFTYKANLTIIFMFGDGLFWEWDEQTDSMVTSSYPLPSARYWKGVPSYPEAAASDSHGRFYFFKGPRYFKLRDRVSVGISRPLGRDWFRKDCNSIASLKATAHQPPKSDPALAEEEEEDPHLTVSSQSQDTDETDSAWVEVPFEVSDLSPEDIPKERASEAPLPFEFDFGDMASGHESERYVPGRH